MEPEPSKDIHGMVFGFFRETKHNNRWRKNKAGPSYRYKFKAALVPEIGWKQDPKMTRPGRASATASSICLITKRDISSLRLARGAING